jgi:hypothetical protein
VSDQLEGTGESALAVADERDALREALVYWNASRDDGSGAFKDSATSGAFRGTYVDGKDVPAAFFEDVLGESISERTVYNVQLAYWNGTTRRTKTMVYSGRPTVGAVTVSRTVTLYDDDRIPSGESLSELGKDGRFYVGDQADGEVYAVIRVEVTLWRA